MPHYEDTGTRCGGMVMQNNEYDIGVLTAMFVDDSPYMRRLIHDLLIAVGFGKVITANDGESAFSSTGTVFRTS